MSELRSLSSEGEKEGAHALKEVHPRLERVVASEAGIGYALQLAADEDADACDQCVGHRHDGADQGHHSEAVEIWQLRCRGAGEGSR